MNLYSSLYNNAMQQQKDKETDRTIVPIAGKTIPAQYEKYLNERAVLVMFDWRQEGMPGLCEMIHEWRSIKLLLSHNNQPTILKQIAPIHFPILQVLCLTDDVIESIEPISQLNAPCMTYINLNHNLITSLKPLSRCVFPFLDILDLSDNKIVDFKAFVAMSAPKLRNLYVEICREYGQPDQYINWVAKLEQSAFKLTASYVKRILVKAAINALRKKYGPESIWDEQLQLFSLYQT